MNIIVSGGCGFTGSVLVLKVVQEGHRITVIDNLWFGNYLPKNKNIKII